MSATRSSFELTSNFAARKVSGLMTNRTRFRSVISAIIPPRATKSSVSPTVTVLSPGDRGQDFVDAPPFRRAGKKKMATPNFARPAVVLDQDGPAAKRLPLNRLLEERAEGILAPRRR